MKPIRLALISLPVLLGATLAGCGYYTERTVYTPAPAPSVAVVPSSGYYYYPARGYYYREPYYPAYYSSY